MEKTSGQQAHKVSNMELKLTNCWLYVDDHDKALGFYRDALGLEVRQDVSYGEMRWVSVGPKSQPEIQITLGSPFADPNASPEDQKAIAELVAKGVLGVTIFTTEDVDKTFEEIQATGAEVVQEPIDQQYGVRDCAFRDPAGNMVRINQPKG